MDIAVSPATGILWKSLKSGGKSANLSLTLWKVSMPISVIASDANLPGGDIILYLEMEIPKQNLCLSAKVPALKKIEKDNPLSVPPVSFLRVSLKPLNYLG